MTEHRVAWRVTMLNPDGNSAAVEQFPDRAQADDYAAGVRRRHPDWDVDVVPWSIRPGLA